MWQGSHNPLHYLSWRIVAIIEHRWLDRIDRFSAEVFFMLSARTIATWASVAVVACSIFAFSWVGLALLGF
jgi:hypothetical protein